MKGKCYYCNKELTERTIKRHIKNCSVIKESIEEKMSSKGKLRKQFIISMKPKYEAMDYCIYLSIDSTLGLIHIDKFIRDIWVECCGHISQFIIDKESYNEDEMNIKLDEILKCGEKFEYEYDFGSTTSLSLEVVDIIDVPNDFTQIEIIARNNEIKNSCEKCGAEAKYFNYEKDNWVCENCIDEEDDMIGKFNYCNSPRDGVCSYQGSKEAEDKYLPGNNNKYKLLKGNISKRKCYDHISDCDENNVDELFGDFLKEGDNVIDKLFQKGICSFDIKKLLQNLNKNEIYEIAKNLNIDGVSNLNKNDLVDKLLNEYEESVKKVMNLFDERRYKFLKKCINNSGSQTIEDYEVNNTHYFISIGMLFGAMNNDGKKMVLVPEVVQNLVKEIENLEYRNIIKENSIIINLFRGMNRAYGIIKSSDIENLFERYGIGEVDSYRIQSVIKDGQYYYTEYEQVNEYFVNDKIDMWTILLDEIEDNLDYAMISKEELLSMAEEGWIYNSKIGRQFEKEITNMFDMDKDTLNEFINSLIDEIQQKDLDEIINEILETSGTKDKWGMDIISTSVGKLLRSIRLWKYKGATINEKTANKIKAEKKTIVGRNEPCPCGSGKKYKKCCGKNDNVIRMF